MNAKKKRQIISEISNLGLDIVYDAASLCAYSFDNSNHRQTPLAVCYPNSTLAAQKIIKYCCHNQIKLTTRGAATATTGAAVASDALTLIVSTEKLNQILKINLTNQSLIIEPGATNQEVQKYTKEYGFFWPPDPSSMSVSTIGGNLATNASGPRAYLYGSTRENVLAIKAIDGTGKLFESGFECTKYSTGYDLVRLLIGSEGTLAFITEATLKLKPIINSTLCQLYFDDLGLALEAIIELRNSNIWLQSIELLDSHCLKLLKKEVKENSAPQNAKIMLIIEIIDFNKEKEQFLKSLKVGEVLIATNELNENKIRTMRKSLSPAIKKFANNRKNEDVVVPFDQLINLFELTNRIEKKYQLTIINFGHVGNANLHCNIMYDESLSDENQKVNDAMTELMTGVINLGGAISGEHGIGLAKKEFINQAINPNSLNLMKQIKSQFDPHNILNPGKIW